MTPARSPRNCCSVAGVACSTSGRCFPRSRRSRSACCRTIGSTMTLHDGRRTLHAARVLERRRAVPACGRPASGLEAMVDGLVKIIDDLTRDTPDVDLRSARPSRTRRRPPAIARCSSVLRCARAISTSALHFWSKRVARFDARPTSPIARHIAVHVALAVSHEQLAEAARRAAAARARAERLEARVQVAVRGARVAHRLRPDGRAVARRGRPSCARRRRWPRPTRRSCSPANRAPARKSSRATSIARRRASEGRSSP